MTGVMPLRDEWNRGADRRLADMLRREGDEWYTSRLGDGWWAVDLPADVWALVYLIGPEYRVLTFRTRADRETWHGVAA